MKMPSFPRVRIPWLPLTCVAVAGALAHRYWIGPFEAREEQVRREIADLTRRTEAAHESVKQIQDLELESAAARVAFERWQRELPPGSAMLWLPDRIKTHFARFGLMNPVSRLNTTVPEPGLPRLKRSFWAVEFPITNAAKETTAALLAVAELDQQDALVRVLDFSLRPDTRKGGRHLATLNISVLAGK